MAMMLTILIFAGLSILACWGMARARRRRRDREIAVLLAWKQAMEKRPDLFVGGRYGYVGKVDLLAWWEGE